VDLEAELGVLLDAGDLHAAATRAIQGYGPEVLGFLVALVGDEDEAGEALAQASADLWAGLPRFARRAALRTWFYTLARHAAARLRRSPHRRPGRHVALSDVGALVASVRTATAAYRRTEVKDRFAAIRDGLPPDDRALLLLRVDRQLGWRDIVRVMNPDEAEEDLERAAARLRKRFQLVKDEIRARARAAGLLRDEA